MVEVNKPASQRTTDMCKNIISLAEVITGNEVHEATNFRFVLKSVTCSVCASRHKWSLIKNPSRFLAHGIIMILFLLCHSLFTSVQFPIKSSEHKAPGTCFLMMSHSLTLSRRACPQSTSCLPSTPGGLVIDSPSWLNIIFCFTSKQQGGGIQCHSLCCLILQRVYARVWLVVFFLHEGLSGFLCVNFLANSSHETACAGVLSLHIRVCLCFIHCEPGMYFFTTKSFPASSQVDLSRQTAGSTDHCGQSLQPSAASQSLDASLQWWQFYFYRWTGQWLCMEESYYYMFV